MNRQEFMKILSKKIDCLPDEEKKSAISYYEEFFDDASIENEQSVISNFGSPELLAESILKSSGCFIETNNDTTYKPNFDNRQSNTQNTDTNNFNNKKSTTDTAFAPLPKPKNNNGLFKLLLILVILITSPVWIGLLFALFGILIALFATCFGLTIAFFAIPIGTISAGIWLIPTFPFASAICFGLTAIFIGLLILLIPAIKWVFKGIGYAFKGIGNSIKNIFIKRR